METFFTAEICLLLTLTFLEIVFGIDNILFVSIIAGKIKTRKDNNGDDWSYWVSPYASRMKMDNNLMFNFRPSINPFFGRAVFILQKNL